MFCLATVLHAQFGAQGTTHAVIIGISDYQDDDIPDLQFAHKDAEAFAKYLRTVYAGKVDPDNISLLINEEATGGKVHNALNRLLETCSIKDKIFIYFSGHGDVSSTAASDLGHLLLHDTPAGLYEMSSLRITDLQNIAKKISVDIGAELIIITDACRSGNVASSLGDGVQSTSLSLAAQFANETKILSCQPNELALEGVRWGGGRGVFSYHLIDGLTGLADSNNDLQVTLRELQRYLEDTVEEDVAPSEQSPMLVGSKNKVMAYVDESKLAQLVLEKSGSSDNNQTVVTSILTREVNAGDSKIGRLMSAFQDALSTGYLLAADGEELEDSGQSALDYYEKILPEPIPEVQKNNYKGQLVAALIDDAQAAINAYLNSDNEEVERREVSAKSRYKLFSNYLEVAAGLLEPQHYLFGQLKAKSLYFDALDKRLSAFLNKELYEEARKSLEQSMIYDSQSAFVLTELGIINADLGDYEEALQLYSEAIKIAPRWAIPYSNSANVYLQLEDYDKAEELILLAMKKQPHYSKAYSVLSLIYNLKGQEEESMNVLLDYIAEFGDNFYIYLRMSLLAYDHSDFKLARKYAELSNATIENFSAHMMLGSSYYGDVDSLAQYHWEKALHIDPKSPQALNNLAWMHQRKEEYQEAIDLYKRVLENDPLITNSLYNLGVIYYAQDSLKKAYHYFETIVTEADENHVNSLVYLAKISGREGDSQKIIAYLTRLRDQEFQDLKSLVDDELFGSVRSSSVFNNWILSNKLD